MRANKLMSVVLLCAVMAGTGFVLAPLARQADKPKNEPITCTADMVHDPSSPCWRLGDLPRQ